MHADLYMPCLPCRKSKCPAKDMMSVNSKAVYMAPFDQELEKAPVHPKVVAAMNTNQTKMDEVINTLAPSEVHRVAGAGNKFVHLATGKSDTYLNFVPGLKLWDTCAGDAIIKSRYGVFMNAFNEHIDYSQERVLTPTLQDGIIACKNPSLHRLNLQMYQNI